ncbi:Pseudouridine synthase family protein [Forsythia ovata]|uniref:Pseudouridine synthase family protein n=1 Tax=Forsythia ovata TaxID=205694 RepID=A0ABD1WXP6_9LAMI
MRATEKWVQLILLDSGFQKNYEGWQYQQSTPAVQYIIEEALTRITKLERKDLLLVGAGRPMQEFLPGVKTVLILTQSNELKKLINDDFSSQVAHFIKPFNYDSLVGIHKALNGLLPSDIRVREISSAVPEFYAHFSVKQIRDISPTFLKVSKFRLTDLEE